MPASATTRLEPPYETNGSVMPVTGATPSTAARLVAAWAPMSTVRPAASSEPKRSGQLMAMRMPAQQKTPNAVMTPRVPTRPSSSPTIAKIMSVCASGR